MKESYDRMRPGVDWLLANAKAIEQECLRWHHLLRIDSNRAMDFWINDADPMYVFGKSVELAAGCFAG